jgi:hypothetical protein
MNDISAAQARERLSRAGTGGLDSPHDRRVHGWAVAGVGVLITLVLLLSKAVGDDQPWRNLVLGGFVVLVVGLFTWRERTARTVPRHTRRIEYLGAGGSFVLSLVALGVAGFWSNVWVYALCVVLAAAPSLVAGAVVGLRGRR